MNTLPTWGWLAARANPGLCAYLRNEDRPIL